MMLRRVLADPHARPVAILLLVIVAFALIDWGHFRFLSPATAASTFETFATIGIVALGLGVTMIIREFDLSVAGVFSLAGCIAVLSGGTYPWLGLLAGVGFGAVYGAAQGFIIARLALPSVGVTLGGLLISVGLASVLTSNRAISYDNLPVVMAMSDRYAGIFSIRSLSALFLFAGLFFAIGFTRIGRDIIAAGSNRQAAIVAGVDVDWLLVATFAFSGAMAALGGSLLSYSLAAASPGGLADILVPAVAAAIIGGVSLTGGRGRPLGIACGVLVLAVLRAGFNAAGLESWVSEVATALVLLIVSALDMPLALRQRRQSSA